MGDATPFFWDAPGNHSTDDNNSSTCPPGCISSYNVALTVVSSVASIVGSLLIICTFLRWKDLRTIARMILVFLAIADLFTGIGYIFAAGIYIRYFFSSGYCDDYFNSSWPQPPTESSQPYNILCKTQSFLTTLMPMASFFWTANLAIYLFFSVVWLKVNFAKTIMVIFHVTAWGIPLVTCVAMASTNMLGSSKSRSSGGWCWIKWEKSKSFYVAEFFAGKGWEIAVCILVLTICVAIKIIVWRRVRAPKKAVVETEYSSISMERQMQAAYSKLDQKLIWLPVAFLLLRIWGNIRFFISIGCSSDDIRCCRVLYHPSLVFLQSIGDPGQGWSNALLFVIFNQRIAQRLCPCLSPLGEWCCLRLKGLNPREWWGRGGRGSGRRDGKPRVINRVTTGGEGRRGGERNPLLLSDSLTSTGSVSTNVSTSSVLYHSTGTTAVVGDNEKLKFSRPKNPSINSK